MKPLIPYFEPFKIPLPFEIPLVGADAIHGFGILVAIGFMSGTWLAGRHATRSGLDPELINRVIGWLVVGVFLGGHWGHLLLYYPDQLIEDPTSLFRFTSGLSSFGGFVVSIGLGVWFFTRETRIVRRENQKARAAGTPLKTPVLIWGYADSMWYGFTLGWFFGRMGCFSAHDHAGNPTDFWLGVYGMNPRIGCTIDVACHDLGLYEGIWSLAMLGLFVVLDRKARFPGFFVGTWLVSYGICRLAMDFFRYSGPGGDTRYLGLTPAQYGSVIMVAIGLWIFAQRRHKTPTAQQVKSFLGA